ncbi:MAG: MFS transporter, partial [Bacilli bacterium]
MALASMIFSGIAGPLSDKVGTRWFGVVGLLLLGVGTYLYSGLTPDSTTFDVVWRLMLAGTGMGMSIAPIMGATVLQVSFEKIGMASGVVNVARTLGTVFGVAILVVILNAQMTQNINAAKSSVISLVKTSKLSVPSKQEMIKKIAAIKSGNFSGSYKQEMTLDQVLKQMDRQEAQMLVQAPKTVRDAIKQQFAKEKSALEKLWPQVNAIVKNEFSSACSST